MIHRLFVYGTLAPGQPNAHVLGDVPGTWEPARVTGTLLPEGWGAAIGYPGIVLDSRGETVPGWGRTLQLLLSPAIALAAVLSGRWAGVLLVAVAARLAVDPQDNAYYVGSAALAAVVFDLLGTRWTMPWATVATVVALWQPFVLDYPHRLTTTSGLTHWWFAHPGTVGAVHLAWAVAMVVVVFVHPRTCEPGDPAIS